MRQTRRNFVRLAGLAGILPACPHLGARASCPPGPDWRAAEARGTPGQAAALPGAPATVAALQDPPPDQAARLHASALVVDTHVDTPEAIYYLGYDISRRLPRGQVDIPRMREGNVGVEWFSVWVDSIFSGPPAVKQCLRLLNATRSAIAANPRDLALALDTRDIERARRAGRIAAMIGIEGGHTIDDDLGVLRAFYDLGARYMTLVWATTHNWMDSCTGEKRHGGLAPFGREVVREMNRMGMLVDISHASDAAFWDVLKVTSKPVIASHSSCRALVDVPRNMTDEQLRALAKNGGVVGINFSSDFVSMDFRRRLEAALRQRGEPREVRDDLSRWAAARYDAMVNHGLEVEPPPLDDLLRHIDHAVKIAGVDHVGLGSDFDGVYSTPRGVEHTGKLGNITRGLLARGYSEEHVRKILGLNFMRVFTEVLR